MISEKTVELNLTTELSNWLWKVFNITFTAIAPSQRAEAKLGYDVAVNAPGFAFFIQYKRAHVRGTEYIYNLNRTAAKDQHAKLIRLQNTGVPVFYAFPIFTSEPEVIRYRRKLLHRTLWLPPSCIPVPGGGVGHHEFHFDSSANRYWVTSDDEIDFQPGTTSIDRVYDDLGSQIKKDNINEAMLLFNQIFIDQNNHPVVNDEFDDASITGISLMATCQWMS